MFISDDVHFV